MLSAILRLLRRLPRIVAAIAGILTAATLHAASVTFAVPAELRADDCTVHVVDDGAERMARCGEIFRGEGKRVVAWIESAHSVMPFQIDVTAGGSFRAARLSAKGNVVLPANVTLRPGERMRVVSLVPPEHESARYELFVRELSADTRRAGFPAGPAVALRVDARGRTGAAERIVVTAGGETIVQPSVPSARESLVVAWLARPRRAGRIGDDAIEVRASDAAGTHRPEIAIDSASIVFSMWRNLDAAARIVAASRTLWLPRDRVEPRQGAVTGIEESFAVLPALTLRIGTLPEDARVSETMALTITAADATELLATRNVEPGRSYSFDAMPAALLEVELKIGDVLVQKHVDLTSGADAVVELPLEPLVVSGTVYRGESPARARLRFLQNDRPLDIATAHDGSYSITLWQPRRYIVEVSLVDRPEVPPFAQEVAVDASRTLDIRLPENALRVRLYDSADGTPIRSGRILLHNRWQDGEGTASRMVTVDVRDTWTSIPPLRIGTAEMHATAPGYASAQPVQLSIDASLRERTVDIAMMRREESAAWVQIRLSDQRPAAGAELAAWKNDQLAWRVAADEQGRVELPPGAGSDRIVVRHPAGASQIVRFLDPGATVVLEPAAPPLAVRVVDERGDVLRPPASASLVIVLAGTMTGAEAAFMTWSSELAAANGVYLLRGLAARPLRVLATSNGSQPGTFSDASVTTISFPWPRIADVRLVPR